MIAGAADTSAANAETFATRDGVPIAYDVEGTGALALVFIHGWSCDRSYWDAQRQHFARTHRVVTVDLAGHGESGADRKAWTIDSFGEDVAALVEALGLERVVLVGHSMGGDVAVAAARRLPDRVKRVVWVDTYRKLGAPRTAAQVQAIVAPFRDDFSGTTRAFVRGMFPEGSDERLVNRVAEDMASAPPPVAIPALESSLTFGRTITETLKQVKAPVTAINPETPPTDIESMKRHGVEVVQMPGGHFLMMEHPEQFNAVLERVISN